MLAGDGGVGVSQQRAVELQSPPPAPEANGAPEPQVLLALLHTVIKDAPLLVLLLWYFDCCPELQPTSCPCA
jgi:hypothetical protein